MGQKKLVAAFIAIMLAALAFGTSFACGEAAPAITENYQIGERVTTSREMLTVLSTQRTSVYRRHGPGAFIDLDIEAPPTTVFIIVEATIISRESGLGVSPNDFALESAEGFKCARVNYEGRDPFPGKKLKEGESAYGHIAFIAPEETGRFRLSCGIRGTPSVLGIWTLEW